MLPNTEPTAEGNLVYPSLQGATNWFSPSYSPQTGSSTSRCARWARYYYKGEAEYEAGLPFTGGGERALWPMRLGARSARSMPRPG